MDETAFKAALRYIYCGKLPSSQSDFLELYKVALAVSKIFENLLDSTWLILFLNFQLHLEKLKPICENNILRAMDETNFAGILDAASKTEFSEYFQSGILQFVGG